MVSRVDAASAGAASAGATSDGVTPRAVATASAARATIPWLTVRIALLVATVGALVAALLAAPTTERGAPLAASGGDRRQGERVATAADGPIVLIVVDTLRADHLDCYGYGRPTSPSFCALARDGILFERAYTPRTSTTPAIASILTGLSPHRHGVRRLYQILPPVVPTLPALLRERGYRTGAFVSSFVMVREMNGFDRGFDVYDDRLSHAEGDQGDFERHAGETVERALAWLRASGPGAFLFVHLIEPHGPYTPGAEMAARFALAGGPSTDDLDIPVYQRLPELHSVGEYVGRYDGEIATADAEIGKLLAGLRALGWYDRATIVATADHGESMGEEGDWFRHGRSVHDAEARVPLVLKLPAAGDGAAVTQRRVDAAVSLVDILPTLTAVGASIATPAGSGKDLSRLARGEPRATPPLTEILKRDGLVIAAHGDGCTLRWWLPRGTVTADGRLVSGDGSAWTEITEPSARLPADASPACVAALRRAASSPVADLLTFARGFPVAQRSDVSEPAERARFLAARGDPIVPLEPAEHEALRQLGYVE